MKSPSLFDQVLRMTQNKGTYQPNLFGLNQFVDSTTHTKEVLPKSVSTMKAMLGIVAAIAASIVSTGAYIEEYSPEAVQRLELYAENSRPNANFDLLNCYPVEVQRDINSRNNLIVLNPTKFCHDPDNRPHKRLIYSLGMGISGGPKCGKLIDIKIRVMNKRNNVESLQVILTFYENNKILEVIVPVMILPDGKEGDIVYESTNNVGIVPMFEDVEDVRNIIDNNYPLDLGWLKVVLGKGLYEPATYQPATDEAARLDMRLLQVVTRPTLLKKDVADELLNVVKYL